MIETREQLIEWLESAKESLKAPGNVPVCCHDELGNVYTFDTPFKVATMIDTTGNKPTIQMLSLPIVVRKTKVSTLQAQN